MKTRAVLVLLVAVACTVAVAGCERDILSDRDRAYCATEVDEKSLAAAAAAIGVVDRSRDIYVYLGRHALTVHSWKAEAPESYDRTCRSLVLPHTSSMWTGILNTTATLAPVLVGGFLGLLASEVRGRVDGRRKALGDVNTTIGRLSQSAGAAIETKRRSPTQPDLEEIVALRYLLRSQLLSLPVPRWRRNQHQRAIAEATTAIDALASASSLSVAWNGSASDLQALAAAEQDLLNNVQSSIQVLST